MRAGLFACAKHPEVTALVYIGCVAAWCQCGRRMDYQRELTAAEKREGATG